MSFGEQTIERSRDKLRGCCESRPSGMCLALQVRGEKIKRCEEKERMTGRHEENEDGCSRVGEVDFADQGCCGVMAVNRGKVRIYEECETGLLQGAEMFGTGT